MGLEHLGNSGSGGASRGSQKFGPNQEVNGHFRYLTVHHGHPLQDRMGAILFAGQAPHWPSPSSWWECSHLSWSGLRMDFWAQGRLLRVAVLRVAEFQGSSHPPLFRLDLRYEEEAAGSSQATQGSWGVGTDLLEVPTIYKASIRPM